MIKTDLDLAEDGDEEDDDEEEELEGEHDDVDEGDSEEDDEEMFTKSLVSCVRDWTHPDWSFVVCLVWHSL